MNSNNPKYGTYGGENTLDYLFCLSVDEVNQYFRKTSSDYFRNFNEDNYDSDEEARQCSPTFYAMRKDEILNRDWGWDNKKDEVKVKNGIRNRIKKLGDMLNVDNTTMHCPWWLRTPGRYQNRAVCVGYEGAINVEGRVVSGSTLMVVRPAMWVKD